MGSGLARRQRVDGKMCRDLLRSKMDTATVLRDTEKAVRVISHVRERALINCSGGSRAWDVEKDKVGPLLSA